MIDRPLNILTVTSIYPTPEEPGLGAFVASQVNSLRNAGLGVDVLFLDARRSKWELVSGIRKVRDHASSGQYDLVHAHFGYNGVPACMQSALPVVVSFCGTDIVTRKLRAISRWVARRADANIVKSARLRDLLGCPAEVIPNGVDLDHFRPFPRPRARRRLGLRPDVRYALFAADPGRPEKRYELARAALTATKQSGTPVELLLLHNQPPSVVPDYLNAADVLLLTSSHEGSPNIVKEALACNLPIVSTDVGDVREILGNARSCSVCGPAPESLAAGIRRALQNGTLADGRARIAHLSADAVADRITEIYRRVIASGGRP